jgi:ornithine carbamoyltransferase
MGKKDLVSVVDFSADEAGKLLELAAAMKARPGEYADAVKSCTAALVFEKPSLRTRVTFEVGMTSMGGHAIYLAPADIKIGKRESAEDVARNLERWVQVIVARTFAHATVVRLAESSRISVINALSDTEHPCQALADFLTLREQWGDVRKGTLTYVGDGNNTCTSLALLASGLGCRMRIGTPEEFRLPESMVSRVRKRAEESGAEITFTSDPVEAVTGADAVYTDTWVSMGKEEEKERRRKIFRPYQVNAELMKKASPNAVFLHCLPAYRGEEVTDEVIDGPRSVVFDEAENRLHIQKAILYTLLKAE